MTKLLQLMREKRRMETKTLDGYKFFPTSKSGQSSYNLICDELEIEQKTISGQNKTLINQLT